jgi:carboxymethylenebutenolidase
MQMPHTQPDGYLAVPPAGQGPGVLVLHAWWGLNDTIKAVCDRLAEAGFVAFAPDLYHGKVVDTIADAETQASALGANADQAQADLSAAIAFLTERAGATDQGLTVLGFSLGANYALDLSSAAPDAIRAVVLFYGTGGADFSRSRAAYLGHFAGADPYEPEEGVAELEAALKSAGRPVTFYRYPDTGHWFMEPDRVDAYNPEAARLAWDRTLAFLKQSTP